MIAVGDGAIVGVDVSDEFGEVERELAVGFDGSDVVGAGIIFAGLAGIVAVRLDDDDVVGGDEVGQVVAVVIGAAVVFLVVGALVVALAVAVEPVDDGVASGGGVVGGREEDAVVAGFVEDLAFVGAVEDYRVGGLRLGGLGGRGRPASTAGRSGTCPTI